MTSEREYIVFCDESDKKGKFYSNFYGGVLVGASQYQRITKRLNDKKQELNLLGEVKWSKVSEQYLSKYEQLIQCFFEEIIAGNIKVRVMFTQNAIQAQGLTKDDIDLEYYKLYYQFIKHAFGLRYVTHTHSSVRIRLYFDQFPDTGEKVEQFKGFIAALQESITFKTAKLSISKEDIAEVRSHDHVLLQCLDVVLGAMSFRLNDKHKEKAPNQRIRGKRTRAKESLYKTVLVEIRKTHPNFNIGINTGDDGDHSSRWKKPYRHWLFRASNAVFDGANTKRKYKANDPTAPT